jgi:single-strand DNA-binding protein
MVFPAALLAARPNSSLNAPGMAFLAWTKLSFVCLTPSLLRLSGNEEPAAYVVILHAGNQLGELGASEFLPSRIPSSTQVHASGPNRRPAARRRSASIASPLRDLGTSQNKFEGCGKERRSNFFRAPPRKHSLALGSRAHSLATRRVTRAAYGKFNETEITTMYLNKLTLIGYLGNDAEVRTNKNRSLTTFSLATQSSYKKDGKYINHTEWTRCVVFGKLGEYAASLKKGAHIYVEGEKRTREYESKKTGKTESVTELRVSVIRNLDRTAKAAPEEQEIDEVSIDEEAA